MENFRIDRQNKTFVFDDGEVIPIPKNKEKQVLRTKTGKESKQQSLKNAQILQEANPLGETGQAFTESAAQNFFGNPASTLANYAVSGIKGLKTGEGQEGLGYVDRVLDHFYAMQEAEKENLTGLQKKNPIASNIGKGVGIAGELASLVGVPGAIALPAMGAAHSETSFLEPIEKAKEVVPEAIEGFILDKFFGGLSKIAGHRETQRNAKNLIAKTEEANLAEIERAANATKAENLRFTNETTAREAELKRLEKVQQAENQAFKQASDQAIDRVAVTMGKEALPAEIAGVEDFINQSINTSAHAITKEANYVSKFLQTVFKGDKNGKLTGQTLKKGVQALDDAIIMNEGITKQLLTEYKDFLTKALPDRLASNYAYEKWMPKIANSINPLEKNLSKIFDANNEIMKTASQRIGPNYVNEFKQGIQETINDTLSSFKNNFKNLNPDLIRQEISNSIISSPVYEKMLKTLNNFFPELTKKQIDQIFPKFSSLTTSLEKYPEILGERISKSYEKYLPDIKVDFTTKSGVSQSALQKTPLAPQTVAPPAPVLPAQIIQPNVQPVPNMPQPQGTYGRLAQGLESLRNGGVQNALNFAKQNLPSGAIAQMAGVPIAKIAAGGAALATGARALTSPSQAGNILRTGLEQGARTILSQINDMAQRYPSYHDGIVEDPQEKRSLTKEIENLTDMSIEEKAVYQSKINRGKPLQERL